MPVHLLGLITSSRPENTGTCQTLKLVRRTLLRQVQAWRPDHLKLSDTARLATCHLSPTPRGNPSMSPPGHHHLSSQYSKTLHHYHPNLPSLLDSIKLKPCNFNLHIPARLLRTYPDLALMLRRSICIGVYMSERGASTYYQI